MTADPLGQRSDLMDQSGLLQALQVRRAKRRRRQHTSAQLMGKRVVACDGDGSFSEEDTRQVIHAAVPAHTSMGSLGIVLIRNIRIGYCSPFAILLACFSGIGRQRKDM